MEEKYIRFLKFETELGLSAINSYKIAMEMIDRVLISSWNRSIWDIQDTDFLGTVLNVIRTAKMNPERSIFMNERSLSYLCDGFCESALNWYIKFVAGTRAGVVACHRRSCTAPKPRTTTLSTKHGENNTYPDIVHEINTALENGCTDTQCISFLHAVPNGDVVWEKVFSRSMGKIRFKSDAWVHFGNFVRQSDAAIRQRLIWKTCKEIGLINE